MDHAVQELRGVDRSQIPLDERCFRCQRLTYSCCGYGEYGVSGFLCKWCIDLMDGKYK